MLIFTIIFKAHIYLYFLGLNARNLMYEIFTVKQSAALVLVHVSQEGILLRRFISGLLKEFLIKL